MNKIGVTLDEYGAYAKPGRNDEQLERILQFVGQLPHGLAASTTPSLFSLSQETGTSASPIGDAEKDETSAELSASPIDDSDSGRESPELEEALANSRGIGETQLRRSTGLSGDSSHGLSAGSNSDRQLVDSPTTSPSRKVARMGS